MLEVQNLVKKYGEKTAVNGLSFHIGSGEIVGLLGLNGAGKSTTMNCLTGYIAPTEGTILIDGHDLLKEPDQAKRSIGYLPEVFSFYSDMKVGEYLNFVCDLKGFTRERVARKEHIGKVCRQVGIGDLKGRMIRNLSKGYKQRVGFAQALIGSPKVLILDEPTVGLDPSQIIEIRQLIKESGRESTVIVSSHILSEIQAICSRILVIHNGRIVADGSPARLLAAASAHPALTIRAKETAERIEAVLSGIPQIRQFSRLADGEEGAASYLLQGRIPSVKSETADLREQVFRAFAAAGIALLQLNSQEATLEQLFLHLTGQDGQVELPGEDSGPQDPQSSIDPASASETASSSGKEAALR